MLKIVYQTLPSGEARNLRFRDADYVLNSDETTVEGGRLPDIDTLHTPTYLLIARKSEAVARIKAAGFHHVHVVNGFPPHKQNRLGLSGTSTEKTTCRDLITTVKEAVDAGETVVYAASDVSAVESARDATLLVLAEV